MLPVRVFFKKTGEGAYFSHLDLQRTVCRAILRSGVRPCYTEGFNPHIRITFASPLSVYQESEYEIFDFFAEDDNISYDEITSRLSSAFPECLQIIRAALPVKKLGDIAMADYVVEFRTNLNAKEIEECLSGEIVVIRKSKKGDHPEDISYMIKQKTFEDIDSGVRMYLRASCGSTEHLNVKYIVDFLDDKITDSFVKRIAMLDTNGEIIV